MMIQLQIEKKGNGWIQMIDGEYIIINAPDSAADGDVTLSAIHDLLRDLIAWGYDLSKVDFIASGAWGSDYSTWARFYCDVNGKMHLDIAISPEWDMEMCESGNKLAFWKAHFPNVGRHGSYPSESRQYIIYDIVAKQPIKPKNTYGIGGLLEELDDERMHCLKIPMEAPCYLTVSSKDFL